MLAILSTIILFHLIYFYSISKNNLGLIDIAWGLSFIALHAVAYFSLDNPSIKSRLILITIVLWGLRLSSYLFLRNHNKPEDKRYQKLKENWKGSIKLNAYFRVFWVQNLLMLIISIPSYLAITQNNSENIFSIIGLTIWAIGLFWESWADYTLAKFKKNNSGLCKKGPWQYSRHPNYFGEILVWWGIFTISLPVAWWTVIGPILITFLVTKVSGVPMLEEKYKDNPDYLEYIKTTNAIIPRFS